MKKINLVNISVGEKLIPITIYEIEKDEKLNSISRVYVLTSNKSGKVALIYNSKRKIWGFPGGHPNESETIEESAKRECIEEIGFSIKEIEPKYLLLNKVDNEKEESQVICFAKIDKESQEFNDEDESVTQVKFVSPKDILKEIGNENLWREIVERYTYWLKKFK